MPFTLMYHDVVPREQSDTSGFPGGDAARYKLEPAEFRRHIAAIERAAGTPPALISEPARYTAASQNWAITFDDGGSTAYSHIAPALEEKGWRGHFFVTTDFIGSPPFLDAEQIRDLHRRGHIIGSHSCSHPPRMSSCGWNQLVAEWTRSRAILSDITGDAVTTASVPGGFYSRSVAQAAAQAGLKVLFTSEPTARSHAVDDCIVLGRYTVVRGTSARRAADLASGRVLPRLQQVALWTLKKAAKRVGGSSYLRLRKRLLATSDRDNHENRRAKS